MDEAINSNSKSIMETANSSCHTLKTAINRLSIWFQLTQRSWITAFLWQMLLAMRCRLSLVISVSWIQEPMKLQQPARSRLRQRALFLRMLKWFPMGNVTGCFLRIRREQRICILAFYKKAVTKFSFAIWYNSILTLLTYISFWFQTNSALLLSTMSNKLRKAILRPCESMVRRLPFFVR